MKDFTFDIYKKLLELIKSQYSVIFISSDNPSGKYVFLRHDIERHPGKALAIALLEKRMDLAGTYYFRDRTDSFNPDIISKIASLGHEIGYHYESLSTTAQKLLIKKQVLQEINIALRPLLLSSLKKQTRSGVSDLSDGTASASNPDNANIRLSQDGSDFERAIEVLKEPTRQIVMHLFEESLISFRASLDKYRKLAPIDTISMHGSPSSVIDPRLLWLKYDYHDYGIKLEPYFDIDYNEVFYITDASRKWNNHSVNKRDRVESGFKHEINNSDDIIKLIEQNKMPDKLLINMHPHNWADNYADWLGITLVQGAKNIIKSKLTR